MNSVQLKDRIESLPQRLRQEVEQFIDKMIQKSKEEQGIPLRQLRGVAKGKITIREDFDDPIEDFSPYMK